MDKILQASQEMILSNSGPIKLKGLTQLEWFLTQICPKTRQDYESEEYKHFYRLQQGLEYNVTSWMLDTLADDMECMDEETDRKIVISCLSIIQGAVLVHAGSQRLFGRSRNMALLMNVLDMYEDSEVQVMALHTLICVMVDRWDNLRIFENLKGLDCVCSLLKNRNTHSDVRIKSLEFLYFYLLPEPDATGSPSLNGQISNFGSNSENDTITNNINEMVTYIEDMTPTSSTFTERRRSISPCKYLSHPGSPRKGSHESDISSTFAFDRGAIRRSSEEKQEILRGYLKNVETLVNQMSRFMPVEIVEKVDFT